MKLQITLLVLMAGFVAAQTPWTWPVPEQEDCQWRKFGSSYHDCTENPSCLQENGGPVG